MGVKSRFKVGDRVHFANVFFGSVIEISESEDTRRKIYIVEIENGLEQGFPGVIPYWADEIELAPIELRDALHDSTTYDA
jgi:hypothetical protein